MCLLFPFSQIQMPLSIVFFSFFAHFSSLALCSLSFSFDIISLLFCHSPLYYTPIMISSRLLLLLSLPLQQSIHLPLQSQILLLPLQDCHRCCHHQCLSHYQLSTNPTACLLVPTTATMQANSVPLRLHIV